jgi:hypothetical protein
VRRGRAGRGRHLRSSSLAAVRAEPDCQDEDEPLDGVVVGSGLGDGDEDDEDDDVDGDGDDLDGLGDAGEENLEVGDGDPECFREPGADVPGCGAAPLANLPGAFEPGRFPPECFE